MQVFLTIGRLGTKKYWRNVILNKQNSHLKF